MPNIIFLPCAVYVIFKKAKNSKAKTNNTNTKKYTRVLSINKFYYYTENEKAYRGNK